MKKTTTFICPETLINKIKDIKHILIESLWKTYEEHRENKKNDKRRGKKEKNRKKS